MESISRRHMLALAAAGVALPAQARTLSSVGVQLYTVRNVIEKKPLETLQAIEKIGYKEVEATYAMLDAIWPSLKQTSLRPVSCHLVTQMFTTEQDKLPAAIDDCKKRGFEYAVCPYVAPADRGGPDVMKKLGATLTHAGELCAKAGLKFCYHNHAFEWEPSGKGILLDYLLEAADPKYVSMELDMMWAQVAGVPPVTVLKKYGKRIALMHLKDVAPGTEQRYNEQIPRQNFREVGNGVIDTAAVLKAAADAKVQHYFVEQDQTPGDPIDSLRMSFQNLAKTNF